MMRDGVITFDETLKEEMLLSIFNIIVDDDGYLIENKQPNDRIIVDGRPILLTEFAGAVTLKGKLTFIRNDIGSLIELSDKLKEE